MNEPCPCEANHVLLRLDSVLDQERDALRLLDSRAVEQLAQQKLELDDALRQSLQANPALDRGLVERVRRKAQDNQILAVHARNCVRSVLEAATGSHQGSYDSNRPPPPKAVRFDVKG